MKRQKSSAFVKNFKHKYTNDKNYCKVKDHCHYAGKYKDAVHSKCNLKYSISNEIHVVFHNESNYDYQFIIKELAKELEREFIFYEKTLKNTKPFQF